jgi:hypothetical protein
MFTIRKAQLDALARDHRRTYEDEVRRHLMVRFPADCALRSREELALLVRHAFDRAEAHGFGALSAVSKYANLCVAFGRDFDVDPQHPWAAAILGSKDFPTPEVRIDFLCREALRRLERAGA